MKFKKLAIGLTVIVAVNATTPTIKVFANEISNKALQSEITQEHNSVMENFKGIESNENFNGYKAQYKIATKATVKEFDLVNNEEYNKLFKMNSSNIKSIKNNAGHYSAQNIEKAVDGDLNTYWETNKANTSEWKNEVEIEFKETTELNRIVYGARPTDGKGFAQEFKIYGSKTTTGDTYELVATGAYNQTKNLIEANFEPTEFKRVKFVFEKSNQNWATAREFIFYTEDKLTDEINNIFTDKTYSQLKEEYRDINKINELQAKAMTHPLINELNEILELAKLSLNEDTNYSKTTIVANQHGDMKRHATSVLSMNSFGQNLQATGLYALPGQKVTVYAEVDSYTTNMPVLQFSQNEGTWRGWRKGVKLKPGKNEIIVPSIDLSVNHPTNPKAGGAIYIENPYTIEQQGKAPVIRIEGAERFPFFKEGDNEEEFIAFLAEYKEKLDEDNQTGAKKVLDIVDIESDRMLLSGTTTGAYDAYITKGVKPSETTTFWDESMEEIFRYYGLDGSSEVHDPKYIKEHIRLAQPFGYMYAWVDHVGVQKDVMSSMLNPKAVKSGSWGFIHEIGHRMDTRNRVWGEVTNNMLSMQMGHVYGAHANRVQYSEIYKKAAPNIREDLYNNGRFFESLGMFWQLQLYNDSYWTELNKLYRERKPSPANEQEKMDTLIEYSSEVLDRDLSEYFYRHGFRASEESKAKLAQTYKKLEDKVWYINDTAYKYKGSGINKESKPTIESIDTTGKITISSNINKDELLGYEIIRNGEVIGFTDKNTFIDETKESGAKYNYQVLAYGKDLSTSTISDEVSNLRPNIILQQEHIYLGLKEEFNPLEYVKGQNYNGEDISQIVKVAHNVDTTKKGKYTVKYTLEDSNEVFEKTMTVEVTSATDYLSDKNWESVQTQYGTPRKNTNIKSRVNGDIKEFDKGIGIHANGKIEYNLEGTNYENFEALLGVDTSIAAQDRSSITFKVVGDGQVLATTKILKYNDNMVHINVPIQGIKNLTIEINDGGNGNSSDHGIIANPKLTTNNKKPELEIEKSTTTKVGEPIEDLVGKVVATDTEDGDLTQKVIVKGHENINFNKPGEYKLTYSVTDSDNNTTTKERTISIIDERDYTYLTKYDWKSAVQSYSTTRKDKSVSDKAIRLTNKNNEEVVYERGIGAHANATIIYDLSNKNYNYFTSYIGVDREMYNRPGSVSFEVYVDGQKQYDSGLMQARDPQKFVEVNIQNAKELKLVVKDGGNGVGSDHASWGDTKLYYANEERADITKLKEAIEKAETIESDNYSEESINNLTTVINQGKELIKADFTNQAQCDEAVKNIENAINNLETLDKIIEIPDEALKKDIKNELGIKDREITLRDMHNLVSLECSSGYARSLKGLETAINLESLNIDYNEVTDLSPIANLKKLTHFSGAENFIMNPSSQIKLVDGKFVIENMVKDVDGERLLPKEVTLNPNTNPVKLNLEEVLVGGKVLIDSSLINKTGAVEVVYESKTHNFELYTLSLLSVK
ncbi:NPCBM/NEW2 domain-containing protein [Romboutsia sp.]|uniref:NPCBM/NEW2 domain-containing protein n=1 Tax=Romboutsia sp. TaxID=1965302 RepID=UPI003F3F6614